MAGAALAAGVVIAAAAFRVLWTVILPAYLNGPVLSGYAGNVSCCDTTSDHSLEFHQSLNIVDLHADPMLSTRDFNELSHVGHVDVPRMIQGNMALQVCTSVTSFPKNWKDFLSPGDVFLGVSNASDIDMITLVSVVSGWPWDCHTSLHCRALHQANKLQNFANASDGRLEIIKSKSDLDSYLIRREKCLEQHEEGCDFTAAVSGCEGSHALEGDLQGKLDALFDTGVRLMTLHHFFDNLAGGCQHGEERGGLTEWGHELVKRLEEKGMVIDLTHSSSKVVEDVLEIATKPFMISHVGLQGFCNTSRTISDELAIKVAKKGGILGIGYWEDVTCGTSVVDVIDSILYAVGLLGEDHVALGSDWDGAVKPPLGLNAGNISAITHGLLERGIDEDIIEKVMGLNALGLFAKALPD